MPKLTPDKLTPGMKLAKPVLRDGMLLLNKGTELTEGLIRKIAGMNVDFVQVEGRAGQSIPKDELLSQLERRFQAVEDQPHMAMLKRIVKEHLEGLYE